MSIDAPANGDGTDLDALLKGLMDGDPSDLLNGDAILAELMDGADLDNVDLDALLEGLADGDTDTGDTPQA